MGRGKNSIITPIKRKLMNRKQVAKLVPVFSSHYSNLSSPGESESKVESRAKRRKLDLGVKHPISHRILTLIFTRNIIINIKMELSPRSNAYGVCRINIKLPWG